MSRRKAVAGEGWRAATDELSVFVSSDLQDRYGAALDLLADRAGKVIWDCVAGHWQPPSGDAERKRVSIAWLGRTLVDACEQSRLSRGAKCSRGQSKGARRLSAADRRRMTKQLRSLADALGEGAEEAFWMTQAAADVLSPSPRGIEPAPEGLEKMERLAWEKSERRLKPRHLAAALAAMADAIDGADYREQPRGRSEAPETALGVALVTWIRASTGAPMRYLRGEQILMGGRPLWEAATAFVIAAGWRMESGTLRSRIEARMRA